MKELLESHLGVAEYLIYYYWVSWSSIILIIVFMLTASVSATLGASLCTINCCTSVVSVMDGLTVLMYMLKKRSASPRKSKWNKYKI